MSQLLQSFRTLTPRTRALVGLSLLAWGTAGLYISDSAEKKLGFEPSAKDREVLDQYVPRIVAVERDDKGKGMGLCDSWGIEGIDWVGRR